ncbi:MAG: PepSY domain-containing protein [Pseudomonadota bacterium]
MARAMWMRRFAQWHIWLGWLVGVPIVMWTASGLLMVITPIEKVRGEHLRKEVTTEALILPDSDLATEDAQLREMRVTMQDGRAVAILTTLDGVTTRVDVESGQEISPLDAAAARTLAAERVVGGDKARSVTFFRADDVPHEFRRKIPVWQVTLEDGTNAYFGRDTGELEAVRTNWWRAFDFAWGIHIMDLRNREDTSHPILILFSALALVGALIGCVLMFRSRRKSVSK